MLVSPKQRYLHNDKWYWQVDWEVWRIECVATNVQKCKIIRQGFGEIWHQKGEIPAQNDTHTQQRSTSISTTNHPNPAINCLIGSSWVGLSNRLCLVSNKKSCGYIQTNQLTQKGKKAAVLKEVDVATQPVGQIWWVRTWIKARKQENPTEHVWGESGRNWESSGPPKIAKTRHS